MNLKGNKYYKEAYTYSQNYHQESAGFTKYLGINSEDKVYLKQNNILIGLLVLLHQRISKPEEEIKSLKENKKTIEKDCNRNIEEIIHKIQNIKITEQPIYLKVRIRTGVYSFGLTK